MNEHKALMCSIKYAKNFGFISKSLFWDQFCTKSRATNFRYWKSFLDSGAFLPYRELGHMKEYYYLNTKSTLVRRNALKAVGKRNPEYLYHDEQLMRFIFALEKQNFINNFWTGLELKADSSLRFKILGGATSEIPDLIFDLNCPGEIFRTALEIEIKSKSKKKYFKQALSYRSLKNIDLVLYGTLYGKISSAIKSELSKSYFDAVMKKTAFYLVPEFESKSILCNLDIHSRTISLEQLFKNLIKIKTDRFNSEREKNETTVSLNLTENMDSK